MMCSALSYAQRQTLQLGTAHVVGQTTTAPCNFPVQGADAWYYHDDPTRTSCSNVMVTGCATQGNPNNPLPTLLAYVAVTYQPAGTSQGTVVLLDGDGGTSFFNSGDGTNQYVDDYYRNGHFTTVQFAWAAAWNDNTANPPPSVKSVKDEACRPATLLKYIHDNYAVSSTGAMCAQGHSGGASAIAYAMEFYGADRAVSGGYLDTVVMTSGPTLADIYNGCHYDPQGSQAAASNVCQGGVCVGSAPQWQACLEHAMGGQVNCFPDGDPNRALYQNDGRYGTARAVAMHTVGINNLALGHANCNNWKQTGLDTHSGGIDDAWRDMSLVPVPYGHYPQTFVYGFLCEGPKFMVDDQGFRWDISNSSAAQAWSYLSAISPSPSQGTLPAIYRVNKCEDPEMIWKPHSDAVGSGMSGYGASEDAMVNNCNTTHRE